MNAIRDSIVSLPLSPTPKANQAGVTARASGIHCLEPPDAFYLWPDFEPLTRWKCAGDTMMRPAS